MSDDWGEDGADDDGDWANAEDSAEEVADDAPMSQPTNEHNDNNDTTTTAPAPAPAEDADENEADFEDDEEDEDDGFGDGAEDEWGDDDGNGDWGDTEMLGNDDAIQSGKTVDSIRTDIPERTVHDINSNVDEINMLPMFAACADLKSRSRVGAVVAIKVDRLTNINQDQLEVWGLTPEYPYIALVFEFGSGYLYELQPPKMRVGICKRLSADAQLKAFRLSWTIQERCSNTLLNTNNWPCDIQENNIHIPDAAKIAELMDSSAQEYALVLEALKKCKNDANEVLNLMFDDAQVQKLKRKLPSMEECNAEFRDIMGKISTATDEEHAAQTKPYTKQTWMDEYENADLASQIEQVASMFQMSFASAALIVQEVGYDTAVNQLQDQEIKETYITRSTSDPSLNKVSEVFGGTGSAGKKSRKSKNLFSKAWSSITGENGNANSNTNTNAAADDDSKLDEFGDLGQFGDMVRSSSGGKLRQITSEHVLRSIVVMSRHNFMLRVACYALKVLLNGNKYCMICDAELAFAGLKPTICAAPFCQFRHDQMGLGFSLATEVLHRADIVDLLVTACYSASNSGRIQFFFPSGVRGLDADTATESFLIGDVMAFDAVKFSEKAPGQPTADVAKLKQVLDICPPIDELKPWAAEGDSVLKKEMTNLHCLLYPLIAWIVTSNRSHLRRLTEEQRIKKFDTPYQFALCAQTPEKEAQFQDIQAKNGSFLAFHGSPMGNWHSIMRMGLKNYSKTKHQSNGAAYGNGIYFGRNFALSWSYCRHGQNPGWAKSRYGAKSSCMAFCEICYHSDDAHHHKKSTNTVTAAATAKAPGSGMGSRQKDPKNRWVKTQQIYVVEDEECVTTRFFMIFTGSSYPNFQADTVEIPKIVQSSK